MPAVPAAGADRPAHKAAKKASVDDAVEQPKVNRSGWSNFTSKFSKDPKPDAATTTPSAAPARQAVSFSVQQQQARQRAAGVPL